MTSGRAPSAALLSIAAGAALWLLAHLLTGRREAWDSTWYWIVFYPAAIVAAAAIGHRFPQRPWRWALLVFLGQFLAQRAIDREFGSLWPLGLVLFAVMSLPAVLVATLAAGRRATGEEDVRP